MGAYQSFDPVMTYNLLPPRMMEDRRWTVEATKGGRWKEVLGRTFATKEQAWNFYLEMNNGSQVQSWDFWKAQPCEQAQEDPSRQ